MKRAIAIGASSGGVAALKAIAAGLPPDLPAPVFVVLHIGPHRSHMPEIISRAGPLPCRHPEPGEPIRAGVIYIAPPDLHFLVEDSRAVLRRSAKENWARPAIDPLFRSAAAEYAHGLVGVILSGALNDGTAGLYEISRRGGIAVVQDPADAFESSMPNSALRHVDVDHVAPMATLPTLLARLAATEPVAVTRGPEALESPMSDTPDRMDIPAAFVCPDCGGAMRSDPLGDILRFRCHIGHAFSAETLVEAQLVDIDRNLEAAFRSLKERAVLCGQLARRDPASAAEKWHAAIEEARARAEIIEELLGSGWTRPEIEGG